MPAENLFSQDTTYITIEELKASCLISEITELYDEKLKELICRAESTIDSYIWEYWEKLSDSQVTIFPTQNDWIPLEIKKATVIMCVNIFNSWFLLDDTYKNQIWKGISSETYRGYSVSFFDKNIYSNDVAERYKTRLITDDLSIYLKRYVKPKNKFFRT